MTSTLTFTISKKLIIHPPNAASSAVQQESMAPIRRYLRITKYSVLEVRIYLHRPSDAAWLLSTHGPDPVLPRIIRTVRPKVLPKLREENENAARRKSGGAAKGKKRGIKDVATGEDFEVSIFLKETATRHSLLTKQKKFKERVGGRVGRVGGGKMEGWLRGGGEVVDVDSDEVGVSGLRREDGEDEVVDLDAIPAVGDGTVDKTLFVESSDDDFLQTQRDDPDRGRRRRKRGASGRDDEEDVKGDEMEVDDKKKLAMDTTYDGFSIYGRILCLIVTRNGGPTRRPAGEKSAQAPAVDSSGNVVLGGSQMMEQWISTQAAQDNELLDDDEG